MSPTALDALEVIKRPAPTADYAAHSRFRAAAIAIGLMGLMAVLASLIANLVIADESTAQRADTLAWSFGVNFTGFTVLKLGIATTLMGIIVRLWMRVDSVKAALPELKAHAEPGAAPKYGEINTPFGRATVTARAPDLLFIHRMAKKMYAPMVAMGPMLVVVGLILSAVQAHKTAGTDTALKLGAWVQGTQFLGEGLILSGISFLLGTILASLRAGGGEVQESLGLPVNTLKMPVTAKAFVGLMMMGLMTAMVQLVLYLVAAYGDVDRPTWFGFLAPLREFALGTLLLGIVLALYTIGTVLGFQFNRIKEIIVSGR